MTSQTCLPRQTYSPKCGTEFDSVDSRGFEPLTFALPAQRSSQLNYEPKLEIYYTKVMDFKDRQDAAAKLLELIKKEENLNGNLIIISLLRGGAIIGDYLSIELNAVHYPLVSVKVTAPYNPELAIGAICFEVTHMNTKIVNILNLSNSQISKQVKIAERKFISYCKRFNVEEKKFDNLKGKTVVITDDGVATGSTLITALEFVKSKNPNKIIVALPIAPRNFNIEGIDKEIIIYKDPLLSSISQYYRNFAQVKDEEIKQLKSIKINL